jgi:glycosyltransferase involved in cell wall biosynthesis
MPRSTEGLRVAHVQPLSLDLFGHRDEDWGTNARYFLPNLAFAQTRLGLRPVVHLLTRGPRRSVILGGVPVEFHSFVGAPRTFPGKWHFARQHSVSLVRALRAGSTDVVHFHGARSLHTVLAAVVWRARAQQLPVVAQDQGARTVGPFVGAVHRRALRGAAALLAGNEASVAAFADAGVPRERVHLVPNGVDVELFRPEGPLERHSDERFAVLAVSRLSPEKDPLTLAEAIRRLADDGVPVSVTFAGGGPLRGEIERRLDGSGAEVRFLGHIPQEDLPALYRSADCAALTSTSEGANQVVLEAMACGTPVVASDIPGVREWVDGGGILVRAGDVDAVARALRRLSEDEELRRRLRRRGLDRARSLSWDSVAARIAEIYASVVSPPAPAR